MKTTSALQSLSAMSNEISLADTARVKRLLGRKLSLQERLALLEELICSMSRDKK